MEEDFIIRDLTSLGINRNRAKMVMTQKGKSNESKCTLHFPKLDSLHMKPGELDIISELISMSSTGNYKWDREEYMAETFFREIIIEDSISRVNRDFFSRGALSFQSLSKAIFDGYSNLEGEIISTIKFIVDGKIIFEANN